MLSIHHFVITAIVAIITLFYSVFFYHFLKDQQQKTDLIMESIRHDTSETAYIISTEMQGIESIRSFKSLLNRKVASSPLITNMVVSLGNKILIKTDAAITTIPPGKRTLSTLNNIPTSKLLEQRVFESDIDFFMQDKPAKLRLFTYVDHKYISNYFSQNQMNYLLFFGLFPMLGLGLLWLILRNYITTPLESLRLFAYSQEKRPKPFKLKELEYVRSSMEETFQRLEHEKKELYRLARTDSLSGLANRSQLNERLSWLISEASRENSEFAIVFIDLDNFKVVNDSLGHDIGDELLKNVADLIHHVLREYDIIARVGGDEFVIVLSHYKTNFELTHIIQRIIDRISELHIIESHPIRVSASIGVAFYPQDGTDITGLMKSADIAMYEAKKLGKNQFKFFTKALHQQVLKEIELEHSMRKAIKNNEFELFYQPKMSTDGHQVVGAEALIRWIHPQKGIIPPNDFIPAAEKNGLMVELGEWILQTVVQQQIEWKTSGLADIQLSVNLSVVQFLDDHFDDKFERIIIQSGIDPKKLDIEMTESVFLENSLKNLSSLNKIRDLGVSISLDDFGTGYSSLAYLKALPIDTLKIDKSFMDDFNNETGSIFIETIVKLAHTLKLHVVAEGIETQDQINYLVKIGCNTYQGYYCSPPLPVDQFEAFLRLTDYGCGEDRE